MSKTTPPFHKASSQISLSLKKKPWNSSVKVETAKRLRQTQAPSSRLLVTRLPSGDEKDRGNTQRPWSTNLLRSREGIRQSSSDLTNRFVTSSTDTSSIKSVYSGMESDQGGKSESLSHHWDDNTIANDTVIESATHPKTPEIERLRVELADLEKLVSNVYIWFSGFQNFLNNFRSYIPTEDSIPYSLVHKNLNTLQSILNFHPVGLKLMPDKSMPNYASKFTGMKGDQLHSYEIFSSVLPVKAADSVIAVPGKQDVEISLDIAKRSSTVTRNLNETKCHIEANPYRNKPPQIGAECRSQLSNEACNQINSSNMALQPNTPLPQTETLMSDQEKSRRDVYTNIHMLPPSPTLKINQTVEQDNNGFNSNNPGSMLTTDNRHCGDNRTASLSEMNICNRTYSVNSNGTVTLPTDNTVGEKKIVTRFIVGTIYIKTHTAIEMNDLEEKTGITGLCVNTPVWQLAAKQTGYLIEKANIIKLLQCNLQNCPTSVPAYHEYEEQEKSDEESLHIVEAILMKSSQIEFIQIIGETEGESIRMETYSPQQLIGADDDYLPLPSPPCIGEMLENDATFDMILPVPPPLPSPSPNLSVLEPKLDSSCQDEQCHSSSAFKPKAPYLLWKCAKIDADHSGWWLSQAS